MKIKNILKIGIFSITVFALLISPILKFNTPQANAFGSFLGLFGDGTSATGLNLEDYLNTCSSPGANSIIENNPTSYSVICCNDKDLNYKKVQNSTSYSTIVANCETAQENASDQAIPSFDSDSCYAPKWVSSDYPAGWPLSNTENALYYIENCCKPGDQATGDNAAVVQKQIDKLCQKAEDTLSTYLQSGAVYEEEVDIKDCVYPKGDGNNTTFMALYKDAELYLEKCCNFKEEEKALLRQAEKDLLEYRCNNLSVKDNFVPLGPGDVGETITPPPPPETPEEQYIQYLEQQEILKEESPEGICSGVGTWKVFTFEITFTPPSIKIIQNFEGFTEKVFCIVQKGIVEGLGKMFAGIMNLEVNMILWAFNPDTYGGFVNNHAVQGTEDSPGVWNFLRNLVNMLLVLALVVIAIASILGIKKYSWQQILWKLIIVALLVNFSLVIAGMLLDTSNFLTYYFLNLAKGENENLASAMTSSLDTETISDKDKYALPGVSGATQKETASWGFLFGQAFLAMFVLILIGLFAVIALLAVFLTMIVRSFIIIVLLCLSPIAFAAWIFPDTEKFWKMWWQQFIKWCTYSIIFAFMLYIGVFAVNNLGIKSVEGIGMMSFIVQMVLFSMFLVGGLIFSLQGGGAASQLIMKQSSKIGAAASGFLGYKALKGVTGSETWRKTQKRLEDSKFAPTHDIGTWMSRQPGKIRATELKQIEEDYKGRSPDQIRTDMESHKADRGRVALGINTIAEQKKLNYEKDAESIEIARNQPNLKVSAIKKVHPELYAEYFTKPEDMQNETTKVQSKYPGITKEQVKNRVITNLMADQVIKSSPDNIKSGNWANISDRLEKKAETEEFFGELLDRDLKAEKLAAMINSIDDSDKQTEFINRIRKLMMKKLNTNDYNDVVKDYKARGYRKNPVLRAAFNL